MPAVNIKSVTQPCYLCFLTKIKENGSRCLKQNVQATFLLQAVTGCVSQAKKKEVTKVWSWSLKETGSCSFSKSRLGQQDECFWYSLVWPLFYYHEDFKSLLIISARPNQQNKGRESSAMTIRETSTSGCFHAAAQQGLQWELRSTASKLIPAGELPLACPAHLCLLQGWAS